MFFEDLTPYSFDCKRPLENVLNIGWIDSAHLFSKGAPQPPNVLEKLASIIVRDNVNQMRGMHYCPFCSVENIRIQSSGRSILLGSAEVWVPYKDIIFAAPNLVFHYMERHQYAPPQQFIDALMCFDIASEWDGTSIAEKLTTETYRS